MVYTVHMDMVYNTLGYGHTVGMDTHHMNMIGKVHTCSHSMDIHILKANQGSMDYMHIHLTLPSKVLYQISSNLTQILAED